MRWSAVSYHMHGLAAAAAAAVEGGNGRGITPGTRLKEKGIEETQGLKPKQIRSQQPGLVSVKKYGSCRRLN